MKLEVIINQQGVKRRIEGPFEICIGQDSLKVLLQCLAEAAGAEVSFPDKPAHYFGWIKIFPEPVIASTPNTHPLEWTAK